MITNREALKEYILRQLGAPLVNVELHDDHLEDIISATIKEFSEFAYDGELEEVALLNVDGSGLYNLPFHIQSIIKVSKGGASGLTNFSSNYGSGFVPDVWSSMWTNNLNGAIGSITNAIITVSSMRSQMEKFMGDDMNYDFNSHRKTLRLFEDHTGPLLVWYTHEYIPEAEDYIYDQNWVKKMCTAQARMVQSTITGKYDQALVGGARINYQDMRARAEQEILELKEDLQLQYAGTAPILIG